MKTAIIRKAHFNAAHRLHNPRWSAEKNREIFGKCNNPNFHGHNYVLEVKIIGDVDPQTGYVMDIKELKEIINSEVTDKYDHKNLNLDVADFAEVNPTAENIAAVIYRNIKNRLEQNFELKVRLYETERNIVEYPA
ncbi:MAG: 6-pyruvoyl trahydropterin synthase family protein [Crocinitomicaceae bacterium]